MLEFIACDACSSKPGLQNLCYGCLRNKETISKLNDKLTPRKWSVAMSNIWHQSIPDIEKAFERLRDLDT